MTKVFVSYRREDSSSFVGRMYDRLAPHFGADQIFMGFDTFESEADFGAVLRHAVDNCDVVVVVIGDKWQSITDSSGQRYLDDPDDFVRIEVATALSRGIGVIPVLLHGASMPRPDELPDNLKPLLRHDAIEISNSDFDHHVSSLIEAMEKALDVALQHPAAGSEVPLPMVEWIAIPSGSVTIEDQDYHVEAFQIAKYPVTVEQYEYFIKDDGYNHRSYWIEPGWDWKTEDNVAEPKFWHRTGYHLDKHPVVGVSWYEAVAFCHWLSEKTGLSVMLSTEQQWQRAAQGDDGRAYPWGDEFDASRCNTKKGGSGATTPVDHYPSGANLYGVYDLAGNVREWCLNVSTYGEPGSTDLLAAGPRSLRGGSWVRRLAAARCDSRDGGFPSLRSDCCGFRLSCAYPSS